MAAKDKNKNSVTKKQLVDKVQGLLELAQKQCDLSGYKERGSGSKDEIPCRLVNKAKHILDILMAVPDEADLGYITSVQKVVETSLADIKMDELESQLDAASAQVEKWIHDNMIKADLLGAQVEKNKKTRKVAICVMAVAAIAAIVFFVLESLKVITTNGLLGGLIGLGDILIGIIAFCYELMDDSKTEKAFQAVNADEAVKDDSVQKLTEAVKDLARQSKSGTGSINTFSGKFGGSTFYFDNGVVNVNKDPSPQAGSSSQDKQTPEKN